MDVNVMVARYLDGDSAQTLALDAGVSTQTILNRLRKQGVEVRTSGGRITAQHGRVIAAEYAAGESSPNLAKRHGLTHAAVINLVRRNGYAVRVKEDYVAPRKHVFQEDFFTAWTPDMAYVLGLVATDGSVDEGTLRIYQKEVDLLDQVRSAMGASAPYVRCGNNLPTLRLNSVRLVRDLRILGIHPNKVRTIRAPREVPYPQDFVRGVFDGDGHGGFYRHRDKGHLRIGFTSSSRKFLEDLMTLMPVPIGGPYLNRGCWALQTKSEADAIALRDWMYEGQSAIHSKRKREKLYRH